MPNNLVKSDFLTSPTYREFRLTRTFANSDTFPSLLRVRLSGIPLYISFNTNLSTRKEIIVKSPDCFWSYLSLNMLGLLLCECPAYSLLIFIISLSNTNYGSVVNLTLKSSKIV